MKKLYKRHFKRIVKNGNIKYAGMLYTSEALKELENKKVEVIKFGDEFGCFDISKLMVRFEGFSFWVR